MTLGIAGTTFADLILTALDGAAATLTSSHVDLHTADPGAAGTTGLFSSWTGTPTRKALTWGSASGTTTRQRAIVATLPTWAITGSGTISHLSIWSASTGGSFRFSVALTVARAVINTDTLNLTAMTFSLTPVAT